MSAAAALLGLNAWLARSVFVPLTSSGRPGYFLLSASGAALAVCLAVSLLSLLALQALVVRYERRDERGGFLTETNSRHLRLLWWLGLSLLPLLNLNHALAGRIPSWTYVGFDLRWWWWPVVVAASIAAALPSRTGMLPRLSKFILPAALLAPMAFASLATPWPPNAALHGDEPKYIRYAENLYQGRGFDISSKLPLASPLATHHVFANFTSMWTETAREFPLLLNDLRRIAGLPAPARLVGSQPSVDMFLGGKRPGTVYQLHNPGLAFLLLPAYAIDRLWTGDGVGYNGEFPAAMPAVNIMLLGMFGVLTFATFRLLRAAGFSVMIAAGIGALACSILPAGAFAFQIYPEIPAAIIVAVVGRRMLSKTPPPPWVDVLIGLSVGFLPWLHVRLSMVAAAAIVWMVWDMRRQWRAAAPFVAGASISLGAVILYSYHITGSPLPISNYGSEVPLSFDHLSLGLPAFLVDRSFGLLAHAPVYLFCAAGAASLWRTNRRAACAALVVIGSIAGPAAAYSYWAGGGSPGRYIVALAPMMALTLAASMHDVMRSRARLGAFIALALISLETAASYNAFYHKDVGTIIARGIGGWRLNLLFPDMGQRWQLDAAGVSLLLLWLGALAIFAAVGARRSTPGTVARRGIDGTVLAAMFGTLAAVAAAGAVAGGTTGQTTMAAYLLEPAASRLRALSTFAEAQRCTVCLSSVDGAVSPVDAFGNEPGLVRIRAEGAIAANEPVKFRVRPRTTAGDDLLSSISVDFGDGSAAQFPWHYGDLRVNHTYARPGDYRVNVSVSWDARQLATDMVVTVPGGTQR